MPDFCHLTNDIIDEGPRTRTGLSAGKNAATGETASISVVTTNAELKNLGWLPVVYVNETYDSATQVCTGPTGCNVGDLLIVPDWKQRNLLSEAVVLLDKGRG